jgi:DHA1 family bicyclomycin/chloramphenicol resistance-like MFS transporter
MIAHGTLTYHVAPVLAPVVGGILLSAFGWRSVFGLLTALGLVMLALVLRRLPKHCLLVADNLQGLARSLRTTGG